MMDAGTCYIFLRPFRARMVHMHLFFYCLTPFQGYKKKTEHMFQYELKVINITPTKVGVTAKITEQCGTIPPPANATATDNCDTDESLPFRKLWFHCWLWNHHQILNGD